jgi:hypothetical protein
MYRSKNQEKKSNALIRRTQNLFLEIENVKNEYQHQILLRKDQLHDQIKQDLHFCIMTRFAIKRSVEKDHKKIEALNLSKLVESKTHVIDSFEVVNSKSTNDLDDIRTSELI